MTTYSTGTVSVGAGSTNVTGVGTAWLTSGVRAGDDLRIAGLAGVIASVNSNTSITLARGWPGGAQAGADYDIRLVDDGVRSLVAANSLLQALGQGTLTSLGALEGAANLMPYWTGAGVMNTTALTSAARALLDDADAAAMRSTLGLVRTTSATDTTAGRVTQVGDFGPGGYGTIPADFDDTVPVCHVIRGTDSTLNRPFDWAQGFQFSRGPLNSLQIVFGNIVGGQGAAFRRRNSSGYDTWKTFYTTQNVTVDSNGFLKAASPIVRVGGADDPVAGFTAAGDGAINEAAAGVKVRHIGTGVYQITGSLGLAQSGWQIEVPKDHNGNRLLHVSTDWTDGVLTVTTTAPVWSDGVWIAGDPMDVPPGRWVDVRLHEAVAEEVAE